jgi:hypothetical protein
MIVRDDGDSWQVVLQTDHAELSAQLARRWGAPGFAPPEPFESVLAATARHDDGWAVWERAPTLGAEGRPTNFLEVPVRSHLAFWRAAVRAVGDQDPYAGLLVSMHGSGIYRGRYGVAPELRLELTGEEGQAVEEFVEEQEAHQAELAAELGLDEEERWANYRLLQVCDRLSLHFCMVGPQAGEPYVVERAPRSPGGEEVDLTVAPLGPGRAALEPCPFASPRVFELRRRRLPKRSWPDVESFREALFGTPLETLVVSFDPPGDRPVGGL